MPTVLRAGPYRFFFYAGDGDEPPHVHVERDDKIARSYQAAKSGRFPRAEIGRIQKLVSRCETELMEARNEYFRG